MKIADLFTERDHESIQVHMTWARRSCVYLLECSAIYKCVVGSSSSTYTNSGKERNILKASALELASIYDRVMSIRFDCHWPIAANL